MARGRIDRLIKESGKTQAEIARMMGVSRQAVSNWARGDTISVENAKRLATVIHAPTTSVTNKPVPAETDLLIKTLETVNHVLEELDIELDQDKYNRLVAAYYRQFLDLGRVDEEFVKLNLSATM